MTQSTQLLEEPIVKQTLAAKPASSPARSRVFTAAMLALLTVAAILVHGYHVGIEDQGIYLPAIKQHLEPRLYPHDTELFAPQNRPTLFDEAVAYSSRLAHLSIETTMLLWQLISIYGILWGCLRIARRCFASTHAQWAAVTLLAALLTLGVTGTGLYLVDEYLHPRAPATALLLLMFVDVLDRKLWRAPLWVIPAALLHIQMAFYAVLLAAFFLVPETWLPFARWLTPEKQPWERSRVPKSGMAALLLGVGFSFSFSLGFHTLSTLFEKGSDAWLEAARTRSSHYLLRWEWYEWIGIFGPMIIFWWYSRVAERRNLPRLAFLSRRLVLFAVFIFIAACIVTIPPIFERLTPYQPMRGYHLVYLFMVLFSGGLFGEAVLRRSALRWLAAFVPLSAAMFYGQHQVYPASSHVELPPSLIAGGAPQNPYLQAFAWVRQNTPTNAYFAIDPYYLKAEGDDQHGFRALAERSVMADYIKDSGVVLLFPAIADRWRDEVRARNNWKDFHRADFEKLHHDFGADWALIAATHPAGKELDCPYANEAVRVCRIP